MKLSARDATGFFKKPDTSKAAILLFGPDAMRISLRRKALVDGLLGPNGDEEMRLSRVDSSDLRKSPAELLDAQKAIGFFPGQRVVLVEGLTDATTKSVETALQDWQPGDAILVATAGQLNARSKLRKAFEGARNAYAIAIYADPPDRAEIETILAKAKLTNISPEAMSDIITLGQALDPGDFAQTVEKISLYTLNQTEPVSVEDVTNCAPAISDAALDDVIREMADGRSDCIVPQMQKLAGQGVNPTTLCIAATRHFRQLHMAASSGDSPENALSRMRPPVFGPRRDQMTRQIRSWGVQRLETALAVLMETDLMLRSSRPVPAFAATERSFIRISMLRPK